MPRGRTYTIDDLRLALSPQLIILAGNPGHNFHQHRVDRTTHPPGELTAFGVLHSMLIRKQIEHDDVHDPDDALHVGEYEAPR